MAIIMRNRHAFRHRIGLVTVFIATGPACLSALGQVDPKMIKEGRSVLGPGASKPAPKPEPGASGETEKGGKEWTILIAAFRGENAAADAATALPQIQGIGHLPGAFIQTRGPNTAIVVGSFADPTAEEAHAELKRIQAITVNEGLPYAASFLAPPITGDISGSVPQFDLRGAKAKYGPKALYTLQICAYGREDLAKPTDKDLAEARKAAEEAAVNLRKEGELAFYYHGPNRSMVTIGIFDLTDFDPQTPGAQSQRLREAKKAHPYNLYNGAGMKIRGTGVERAGYVASALVSLPDR